MILNFVAIPSQENSQYLADVSQMCVLQKLLFSGKRHLIYLGEITILSSGSAESMEEQGSNISIKIQ